MILREYQEACITTIMQAFEKEHTALAVLPTGAGKTIIFSHIIKRVVGQWGGKVLVLAHREILVRQALEKLLKVWEDAPIGVACATIGTKEFAAPVVIGSVQTFVGITPSPHFDLVVIDEAHRIPPLNHKSQYKTVIENLKETNPNIRILGVTATPYRLGHGFIYGNNCRPKAINLFNRITYQITIKDLIDDAFLVPYRIKKAAHYDFSHVKRISGGDYVISELEKEMTKEYHIQSIIDAYEKYGEGRKHCVVFCVSIKHAEVVAKRLRYNGYSAECIHSEMEQEQRQEVLRKFESGEIQFIVNVGVLTEGWDAPHADCLIFARPTLSPALYVQMAGRVLRPHPDKKDCLLLDLVNNVDTHGDISSPEVKVPKPKDTNISHAQQDYEKKITYTPCPNCQTYNSDRELECRDCGYVFVREVRKVEMEDHNRIVTLPCMTMSCRPHLSKKGNKVLEVQFVFQPYRSFIPEIVKSYWDIEGNTHPYAQHKAQRNWFLFGGKSPAPEAIDDAIKRWHELTPKPFAMINFGSKYPEILRWVDDDRSA